MDHEIVEHDGRTLQQRVAGSRRGLRTGGEDFDVLQDEATVVVVDRDASTIQQVDPALVSLEDGSSIPGASKVAMRANTTAVLDTASSDLWVVAVSRLGGYKFAGEKPTAELGENADVTVGSDGTVYADSAVLTIPANAQGDPQEASSAGLDGLKKSSTPTITAVGRNPVVLVPDAGVVTTPGGFRTEIDQADSAVLQQSSDDADAVTVATASQLLRVPLGGGEPVATDAGGDGQPAAPVALGGCSYGAWASSAAFVRECPGAADDLSEQIPDLKSSASLMFRVNRNVIVLNEAVSGAAWIATENLQQVDNWDDLTPPEEAGGRGGDRRRDGGDLAP